MTSDADFPAQPWNNDSNGLTGENGFDYFITEEPTIPCSTCDGKGGWPLAGPCTDCLGAGEIPAQ